MAEMTDAQFRQKVIDVLDEKGASVDTDIEQVTEIDDKVTLPGIKSDAQGNFVSYVLARMTVFHQYVKDATDVIVATWNGWFGADDTAGVQKQWKDLKTDAVAATNAANTAAQGVDDAISHAESAASSANSAASSATSAASNANSAASTANTAASNADSKAALANSAASSANSAATNANDKASLANTAASTANTAASNADAKATLANNAASAANTAATEWTKAGGYNDQIDDALDAAETATAAAENVNAEISGMTVTITNRQGYSTSVNIGFEIYRVYGSVAAMNADAANVPTGKFVMIATTDPTSVENARLYGKNSSGSFTFLSDLDQASSEAWADWLNNQKPLIENATAYANEQGDYAKSEGNTAKSKGEEAERQGNKAEQQGDAAEAQGDVAEAQGNTAEQRGLTAKSQGETAAAQGNAAEAQGDEAERQGNVAESQGNTAESKGNTAAAQGNTAEAQGLTAKSQGETARDQGLVAKSQGETARDQGLTAKSQGETAAAQGLVAKGQGETAEAQGNTAAAQGLTAKSQGETARDQGLTAKSQGETARDQGLAAKAQGDAAEAQGDAAEAQGNTAEAQGNTAEAQGDAAETKGNFAKTQGDYAKAWNDNPPYVADGTAAHPGDTNYWYLYDITTEQYVKGPYAKGDNLNWDDMTPAEKQRLIDEVLQSLEDFGFDAVPTQGSTKPVRSGGIYNAIQDEATARSQAVTAEATARSNADTTLQNNIDAEETRAKAAEKANADDIDAIELLIPSAASSGNQLADKGFVNSSIATASSTYRGSYNLVSDLNLTVSATQTQTATALATAISIADNNDYCYVQVPTSDATPTEIARVDRYKYNGAAWAFEYSLNNSGFTAAQWEAINSAITSGLVAKLMALPTNAELTQLLAGKQDNLTFASTTTCEDIIDELT